MRSRAMAGAGAGLIAGVVMGIGMTLMRTPTPDGGSMPMMAMVARIIRSDSLVAGWLYHLANSAVIGAIFGLAVGRSIGGLGRSLAWGGAYGFVWWILGGLVLMPLFLGMPVFAPLLMAPMRPVAMGSLMGHIVYGLLLGGLYRGFLAHGEKPRGEWQRHPAQAR